MKDGSTGSEEGRKTEEKSANVSKLPTNEREARFLHQNVFARCFYLLPSASNCEIVYTSCWMPDFTRETFPPLKEGVNSQSFTPHIPHIHQASQ